MISHMSVPKTFTRASLWHRRRTVPGGGQASKEWQMAGPGKNPTSVTLAVQGCAKQFPNFKTKKATMTDLLPGQRYGLENIP